MPTEVELRNLKVINKSTLDANDANDVENFDISTTKMPFKYGPGQNAGAKTNGIYGIYLGHTAHGNEVWAHLISGPADKFACDAPHRAFVMVHSVEDKRADADVQAVLVSSLSGLQEVSEWDGGIQGDGLVARFSFLYDALVSKAQIITA